MSLRESTVEDTALGWFQDLGYTILLGPQWISGGAAVVQQLGACELIAFQGVKWMSII
jgi:hypothetical protein